MEKIYSKLNPDYLLHIVYRFEDFKDGREDVIDPNYFIQCSALKLKDGHTFKPHKHIWKTTGHMETRAEESWVVIQGMVKCVFYDTDDKIIATPILTAGDASFSLRGGHTYEILQDNTIVYEMKTGPYLGQEFDKEFIDG